MSTKVTDLVANRLLVKLFTDYSATAGITAVIEPWINSEIQSANQRATYILVDTSWDEDQNGVTEPIDFRFHIEYRSNKLSDIAGVLIGFYEWLLTKRCANYAIDGSTNVYLFGVQSNSIDSALLLLNPGAGRGEYGYEIDVTLQLQSA